MAVKRKGLGKGIDSLIPDTGVAKTKSKSKSEKETVVKEIVKEVVKEVKVPAETMMKISDIEPNREQPRKVFDKEALEEVLRKGEDPRIRCSGFGGLSVSVFLPLLDACMENVRWALEQGFRAGRRPCPTPRCVRGRGPWRVPPPRRY